MVIHYHKPISVGQSFEPALVCGLLSHCEKLKKSGYKVTVNWQNRAFKNSRIRRIFTIIETCPTSYGFSACEAIPCFDGHIDGNRTSGTREHHL
jgi:hypothetical protein